MKQIAIIILNYKTWELTLELITKIQQTPEIYRICDLIVVDNCSPNNAYKELSQESAALNYILLGNTSNTGYAAGNNIGLRYAYKQGYEFAWILNNDILLEDSDILNKMVSIFEEAKDVAAISPDIYMPGGYLCNRESIRPGVWEMSLGAISYRKRGREGLEKGKSWLYVYRPQGCCMLLKLSAIFQVGFMDEYTFLYCEELILAERLLESGYRCACCTETYIVHNHSFTVNSSLSKWNFVKSNLRSFDYYLRKYRKFHIIKRWWCNMFYVLKLFMTGQI